MGKGYRILVAPAAAGGRAGCVGQEASSRPQGNSVTTFACFHTSLMGYSVNLTSEASGETDRNPPSLLPTTRGSDPATRHNTAPSCGSLSPARSREGLPQTSEEALH